MGAGPIGFLRRQLRVRPLACFAVAFLAGTLLARKLAVPPGLALALCAASLLAAVALGLGRRRFAAALLLFGVCAGMARMAAAIQAVPEVETRYSAVMTGRVVSEPYTNPDTGRVIARFRLESLDGAPSDLCLRLYLRGDAEPLSEIAYGQTLALTGHIWASDPVTNPYEFDFGDYLRRGGMAAIATAKIEDVAVTGVRRDVQSALIAARQAVSRRVDRLFPAHADLVRALVLGDRSQLSEELREALNRTGTAHLICISGLHVTVLSMALSLLFQAFTSRGRASALTLLLLVPYGALIGFTTPFLRALAMFAVFSFAPVAGYPSDGATRLSVALLACLAIRPTAVADAGFALSFSASAGILLLTPPLTRLLGLERLMTARFPAGAARRLRRRLALYLPGLLCASLAAQLAALPVVIAFFGVQSVVSLPFNLVCVPLCMAGYLLALAALALSPILLPGAALVARGADGLFAALAAIARWSAALPLTVVRVGRYPAALALVHWAIILAASDLSRLGARLRRFLPLGLLAVAGISSLLTLALSWNFSIVFLDAGQADCAVLRTRGRTYVFDAGDTYTPAADYLSATCLRLNGVILSHPHQDHAGGLTDILDAFRPDAVYVPAGWFDQPDVSPAVEEGIARARAMGVPIVELAAGDALELSPEARMTVHSPDPARPPESVNDLSLLALVTCRGQSALFTGDLSAAGEPEVIPDADVLKVAHHGSDKGTSPRFLAATTPDIAIISVGENSYGHPGPETLARLEASGARVLTTRDCGAITLTRRGDGWQIDTFLEAAHEVE